MTIDRSWWVLRLCRWFRWRYCRHDWRTIRFRHVPLGYWAVSHCSKCGRYHVHGAWTGR